MRLMASQLPASAPWRLTASKAYSEQLGVKRQRPSGPNTNTLAGEITQR
jgi:hypothetical protein